MLFSRNELGPLLHRVSANDPELTSLHLSHRRITNRQLLRISDALLTNTHVVEIWLTHNRISDDGSDGAGSVGYLAGVLETNRSVGEVYLGGNAIGAKGASSIANLMRTNGVITDIGLDDNAICDGGAKILADALEHNSTLQTLKLEGNDIQTEGTLDRIKELLKKNRSSAKVKFEREHPELVTHKLKKPEKQKKRSRKGDRRRRGKEERKSRSSEEERRGGEASMENSNAFLEERRRDDASGKPSGLAGKLGVLGLGKKGDGEADVKRRGMGGAAFV